MESLARSADSFRRVADEPWAFATLTSAFAAPGGASTLSSVQSLLTSGRMSGSRFDSSGVGSQVRPSGGPNRAHDFKSLAIAEVVNLASHDGKAARGGVVNALKPNDSSILPLFSS